MSTSSKEFQAWMDDRMSELKDLTLVGPTEAERILADKLHDVLGMVKKEYERTHEEEK